MSIDDIRTLKHADPFRPFEIQTRDGRKVVIEQPLRIALSRSGKTVAGWGLDGAYFDLVVSDIVQLRAEPKRKRKKA